MIVKALISFAGKESMSRGEIKNIDLSLAKDLIKAGYVVEIKKRSSKKEEKDG